MNVMYKKLQLKLPLIYHKYQIKNNSFNSLNTILQPLNHIILLIRM